MGNVATDPEVRYLEQNLPVASFRLATTERGRQNADGSRTPDRTEFHSIVAWRGLAEITENTSAKGCPYISKANYAHVNIMQPTALNVALPKS